VEREIAAEHRRLDALFGAARDALSAGERQEACAALEALAAALVTHFDQEDHLYYPAIAGLCRQHAPSVRAFGAGHVRFLEQLEQLTRQTEEGALSEAAAGLENLARSFAAHEAAEEALIHAIETEVAAVG
jgi:hypothetical protein